MLKPRAFAVMVVVVSHSSSPRANGQQVIGEEVAKRYSADIDTLTRGVDYVIEGGKVVLKDYICLTDEINCATQTAQCDYVATGSTCYVCAGGMSENWCCAFPGADPGCQVFEVIDGDCGGEAVGACNAAGTCAFTGGFAGTCHPNVCTG